MAKQIGTNPDQIPTNADLGTMAYMDYDAVAPVLLGGRRNLIINGAMQIAQRGTSFTGVGTNHTYSIDRVGYQEGGGATPAYTITQESDAPSGFAHSFKIETTTADSNMGTSKYTQIHYPFEGQDLQHLKKGTSDAQQVTLSFWVKSNVTGTYAVLLWDSPNGRQNTSSYTISASGTWEYKTITFGGDTTGTIDNDNTEGLAIKFILGVGTDYTGGYEGPSAHSGNTKSYAAKHAVNVASTVGNYWQITGIQLEAGSVATPFEHRSYGEELALCSRYYHEIKQFVFNANKGNDTYWDGHARAGSYPFPVPMRTSPTVTLVQTYGWLANTSSWTTPSSGRHPVGIGVTNEQNVAFTGSNYWDDPGTGGSAGNTTAVRIEKATVDAEL